MKQSVSLVLSSGSAKGVAHIGVIEELERHGFEIKSIAGSSMGALVGGIYASGNIKVYRDWMCNLDKRAVFNLVDFTLSTNGLVKGNKVIRELKKIVPDVNIEDLPISYAAVATDIKNRKEVIFEKGSLYEAIRASISIPTVFKPYKLNGMVLIDGGVLNPIPINRVKRSKNDLLIAVNVCNSISQEDTISGKLLKEEKIKLNNFNSMWKEWFLSRNIDKEEAFNYYTLLTQSASMMIQQISAKTIKRYPPDILIKVPLKSYGSFNFYKSEEIIKAGELSARKALQEFQTKQ